MIDPIGNVPPSHSFGGNQSLKGQLNTKLVNLQKAMNEHNTQEIKTQAQGLLQFISNNNLGQYSKCAQFVTDLQDTVSANSQDVHDDAMQAGKAGYALYQQMPS